MGLVQWVDLLVFQRVGMGFGMGLGESDCELKGVGHVGVQTWGGIGISSIGIGERWDGMSAMC